MRNYIIKGYNPEILRQLKKVLLPLECDMNLTCWVVVAFFFGGGGLFCFVCCFFSLCNGPKRYIMLWFPKFRYFLLFGCRVTLILRSFDMECNSFFFFGLFCLLLFSLCNGPKRYIAVVSKNALLFLLSGCRVALVLFLDAYFTLDCM